VTEALRNVSNDAAAVHDYPLAKVRNPPLACLHLLALRLVLRRVEAPTQRQSQVGIGTAPIDFDLDVRQVNESSTSFSLRRPSRWHHVDNVPVRFDADELALIL